MMNRKGFGSGHGVIEVLSQYFPDGSEEDHEISQSG
jgi:hypothetical protein